MQGVTEPCYRDLVLVRNSPLELGGAFTEFVRVMDKAIPVHVLRKQLGPEVFEAPVGLQLMGSESQAMAESAARAVEAGAPLVDINFGCPAKGALRGCAGSALLRDPGKMTELISACVEAVAGAVPVTAKIRAGDRDADSVEQLARAAEDGGASLLTIHCRTRSEHYTPTVYWERIARAVEAVQIPVCGNGGVTCHSDLERMRQETGCEYVMVGQAALGDPWIFSGRQVQSAEAARFLLDYEARLEERSTASLVARAGRIKQLLRHWTAGDLLGQARTEWLAVQQPEELLERLAGVSAVSAAV